MRCHATKRQSNERGPGRVHVRVILGTTYLISCLLLRAPPGNALRDVALNRMRNAASLLSLFVKS
jgi:hypothetical protein